MEDGSSRVNLEVYRQIFPRCVQRNSSYLSGLHFIQQQDNDPEHCLRNQSIHQWEKVVKFWT
uniref:Uncharacterized protein n=1 Tax=Anguilla anguilla TaxID=7936 RepID=A0A0E9R0U6_ANGAN